MELPLHQLRGLVLLTSLVRSDPLLILVWFEAPKLYLVMFWPAVGGRKGWSSHSPHPRRSTTCWTKMSCESGQYDQAWRLSTVLMTQWRCKSAAAAAT